MILGADNNGQIVGNNPAKVQSQLDTLAKNMNNPQLFRPTYYLHFEPMEIDGKRIIYFFVPKSGQAHSYKGIYYDRNQDGDFELRSTEQISILFIHKSKIRTENRVASNTPSQMFCPPTESTYSAVSTTRICITIGRLSVAI